MLNRRFFFETARPTLFDGKMTQGQVNGLNAILDEWERSSADKDDRWLAYMLATTHHETDRKMAPIEEYGKGKTCRYGQRVRLDGRPYSTQTLFSTVAASCSLPGMRITKRPVRKSERTWS